MQSSKGQGELFQDQSLSWETKANAHVLKLSRELLQEWQRRIYRHQFSLFENSKTRPSQQNLFKEFNNNQQDRLNPLKLTPLPINFWRWPTSPHTGAAIYLVMDLPEDLDKPLLLYIGETSAADQRWKGEHDCKNYLAAYSEALVSAGLKQKLSIRFWQDVPTQTRARRNIEQSLIQSWLPPFNKETRARWSTPFTTETS